jgi:hypothetical protein
MTEEKLKPCPFCGSEAALDLGGDSVECPSCNVHCYGETIGEAVETWNHRVEPLTIANLWTDPEGRDESWDKPLPEDEEIQSVSPIRTGDHELYAEALRLVNAKHSKYGLVDLVNCLLWRVNQKEIKRWKSWKKLPRGWYAVMFSNPNYPNRMGQVIDGVFHQSPGVTLPPEQLLDIGGVFYGPIPEPEVEA